MSDTQITIPDNDSSATIKVSHSHVGQELSAKTSPLEDLSKMQKFLNAGTLGNLRTSNREYMAEFFGTFVFVSFIIGVVQQCKMEIGGYSVVGNTICWGVGFGFMLGLYMCAGISGGHINPAITLTMAVNRGFPWKKVPWYILVQVLGAFCAALLNYTYFHAQIVKFENGHRGIESAGLFAAFLPEHMNLGNAFYSELVDTAFFAASIFAITDKLNAGATHYAPLALGMMITGIGLSFGSLTGYSMNPARDMGPRIFMSIAGWGDVPWVGGGHFFWVPWIGPALGAVVGGFLYEFFACSTPKKMLK